MNVQNYKNYVRFVGITVICLVIIPIITGCGVKPYKHVAPSFERFEVTHGSICVNEDLPLTVGVTWEADPGNVNEETIRTIASTFLPMNEVQAASIA